MGTAETLFYSYKNNIASLNLHLYNAFAKKKLKERHKWAAD